MEDGQSYRNNKSEDWVSSISVRIGRLALVKIVLLFESNRLLAQIFKKNDIKYEAPLSWGFIHFWFYLVFPIPVLLNCNTLCNLLACFTDSDTEQIHTWLEVS